MKAIPKDTELKAHLDRQMDDHYGLPEGPSWPMKDDARFDGLPDGWGTFNPQEYEDAFQPGPMATEAVVTNLLSAEGIDMVNLPPHYARFKIEPIRFAEENGLTFLQGNIIKYLVRAEHKNGLEDLAKAKRCLEMYIKMKQGDPDWWRRG